MAGRFKSAVQHDRDVGHFPAVFAKLGELFFKFFTLARFDLVFPFRHFLSILVPPVAVNTQSCSLAGNGTVPSTWPGIRLCGASEILRCWLTLWKVDRNAPCLWVDPQQEQSLFLLGDKVVEVTINLLT